MKNNKETYLVSVITPTYNQAEFIEDTINSVLQQTYKNIEFIIIDNNSTDNTEEIVRKYKNYGLKYVRENDSGQADAINKGLDMSKGQIICWLNSDDMFNDDRVIERVIEIFKKNSGVDIIFGNGYLTDKYTTQKIPYRLNQKLLKLRIINILDPILQPSSFWRKNNIRLDTRYNFVFDWEFFRMFFINNCKYYYSDDYFSIYRIYEKNKTGKDSYKRRKEIYEYIRSILGPLHFITWFYYIEYIMFKISYFTKNDIFKNIVKSINVLIKNRIMGSQFEGSIN